MLSRLLALPLRHPRAVLLALAAVTAAAAVQLDELSMHIRAEAMMSERAAERRFYDRVMERFGTDNATVVLLADPELFAPRNLEAIRGAVDALEALPYVERTDSLFSVREFRNHDGTISARPYLHDTRLSAEEIADLRAAALANPLIARNLIARDGSAIAINVHLDPEAAAIRSDNEVANGIDAAIAPLAERLETAFQVGGPYLRNVISERIRGDQTRILPLALLLLLLAVSVALRDLHAALVPLVTAGLSVVWTLGLMAALGIPLNVLTSVVPALLIIIGSTEDIHMLAEYQAGVRAGMSRRKAARVMGMRLGTAILLTFLTTYVGFLSIAVNDISVLRQFGLVASTGLLLNFLITVLFVPLYLYHVGPRPARLPRGEDRPGGRAADWLVKHLYRHRGVVLWSLLPLAIVFVNGAAQLRVNNDPLDYFEPGSEVSRRAEILHEKLAGMSAFSVVLSSQIEGTFLKRRYLEEIQRVQGYLQETGLFDKTLSFADYVAVVNRVLDDEVEGLALPESDDVLAELMLFVRHDQVRPLVSEDYSEARIVVRHNITSSERLLAVLEDVADFVTEKVDPALNVHVTGQSVLTALAADEMAAGQAKSLLVLLVVIVLLISLLFVNLKAGLLAIVPNLVPIVVLFGVMGYAGIALDTGTAMVAVIALGISIDDTLHFMARYHAKAKEHLEECRALRETVREEALPIIATSLALGLGFAVLAASRFPPVVNFGLLSAMVMLLALASTFLITPALLFSVRLITLWDVLSLRLRSGVTDNCRLFSGLRPQQIKKVILVGDVHDYEEGEVIVRQGEQGSDMYVLLDGHAEVWRHHPDGSSERVNRMSPGDVFGEVALMGSARRTADIIARRPVRALALDWGGIDRIARYFPHVAARLFRNVAFIIAGRLVASEERHGKITDPVTGALSMSLFEFQLRHEIDRSYRTGDPVSLIMFCMQTPKAGDPTDSAAAIDAFESRLAAAVGRETRNIDMFARTPEGSLVLLLSNTRGDEARKVAERIRASIDSDIGMPLGDTCLAAGICEIGEEEDPEGALQRAREALRSARVSRGLANF